jgi:hypothetical protein
LRARPCQIMSVFREWEENECTIRLLQILSTCCARPGIGKTACGSIELKSVVDVQVSTSISSSYLQAHVGKVHTAKSPKNAAPLLTAVHPTTRLHGALATNIKAQIKDSNATQKCIALPCTLTTSQPARVEDAQSPRTPPLPLFVLNQANLFY